MVITTTILMFAGMLWALNQEKVQISDNISKQPDNYIAMQSKVSNSLDPIAILTAGDNASTNVLVHFLAFQKADSRNAHVLPCPPSTIFQQKRQELLLF
jgi:hypothetical protein